MLTQDQKNQLVVMLMSKGYNLIDAQNAASGPRALELFNEYCSRSIDAFFSKYLNKGIDQDGHYGNQCMDEMHQYLVEVLGMAPSVLAAPNAFTVFNNFPNIPGSLYFTKVINKWWLVPAEGDVVFFGDAKKMPEGHVCTFQKGNIISFTSFDQNWPMQGYYDQYNNFIGTGVCHFQKHNYNLCMGWLHPVQSLKA